MQTAQREVQTLSVWFDGSEIGSLHNKHGDARGEH
jgi:hypothetical protein